jgi:hypothetical protein
MRDCGERAPADKFPRGEDLSAPNQFVRVISLKDNLPESLLEKKRFAPIWGHYKKCLKPEQFFKTDTRF